jgi:hypothetical protein
MTVLAWTATTGEEMAKMRLRLAGSALVALGLMTGCAQAPQDQYPVVVTTLNGYELKGDPVSAISYSGNTIILYGEVVGYRSPRKVDRVTEAGDGISYIYTPVMVKVMHVHQGDRAMIGKNVAIRAIGGQIGHEKTVSETSPPPEAYQRGMKVYLFTPDFLDAGDGLVAATPNFVYVEDGNGRVYNLHDPEERTHADSFFMMIVESDWLRPQSGG